jgi:hypothetical protein
MFSHQLVRLNAYEGLCLTADDLLTEQLYHRRTLHRHSLFLHGYGIVQGLQVELEQRKRRYTAVIKSGYGITRAGQGVQLQSDVVVPLEVPKQDGEYILWLFHVEKADPESSRPVYDTDQARESRVVESCAPRLHAADEEYEDGVALCRIRVRVGRMVQVQLPVPRAGRQSRAAESYLKPRVLEFIRLNKKALDALFRTTVLQEMSIGSFGFYSALVSAEFLLIEEGTTDRVLYRTAGTLIAYGHDFYNPLPSTTDRIDKFTQFIRRVNAEIPAPDQADETWLRWFESFERLLQPLQRLADELAGSADAMN